MKERNRRWPQQQHRTHGRRQPHHESIGRRRGAAAALVANCEFMLPKAPRRSIEFPLIVQGREKVLVRRCEKFLPALA